MRPTILEKQVNNLNKYIYKKLRVQLLSLSIMKPDKTDIKFNQLSLIDNHDDMHNLTNRLK